MDLHAHPSRRTTLMLGLAAVSAPAVAGLRTPATAATAAAGGDYPTSQLLADEIPIWAGTAPGSGGLELTETITERSTDPRLHDRVISGVTRPSIIPFLPPQGRRDGSAVLLCPGGGYAYSAFDLEGYDIAQWLNALGVAAFVLKYRLPAEGHQRGYDVPLEDGQRALRLIRSEADRWGLDPARIGAMGFSAGGNLVSALGTQYDKGVYTPADEVDDVSARPDFLMLAYPVVTMRSGITHAGTRQRLLGPDPSQELVDAYSNELHVTGATPPTFIVQAHNDPVSTLNSTLFYEALKSAHVVSELHIFRQGGHGFGVRKATGALRLWTALADEWLRASGVIGSLSAGDVVPTVQQSLDDLEGRRP